MKCGIKCVMSGILSVISYTLGGLDLAIHCLFIVMTIDYLTGVISARYNRRLNSNTGFKGILKKLLYLCLVALSVVIDKLTIQSGLIRNMIIYFFVANDGLSIIENVASTGIKLPKKLIDSLELLKKKGD